MSKYTIMLAVKRKFGLALTVACLSLGIVHSAISAEPAQAPLFLTAPVRPLMMLNMSNDHQLFFKAYDDYSDLDADGIPDTTYKNTYEYYGYFDSDKCYVYNTTDNRFNPNSFAVVSGDAGQYCNNGGTTNEWSGNFLNWSTMTRMDAVRKILYGGKRVSDTAALTVLERAFLPNDAHSFAKYYRGSDTNRLTPFAANLSAANVQHQGITICNTTDPATRSVYSQAVTDPPLLRVVQGNYTLWASNERWQCRWRGDINDGYGANSNVPASSGINAASHSPYKTTSGGNTGVALGQGDYNVRVRVCAPNYINATNNENCRNYTAANSVVTAKPSGLLQEFGEDSSIHFGLLTGSYAKNKSGGVLRKNIGSMVDEINLTNGIFIQPVTANINSFNGIIRTLDLLRIYGYNYEAGGEPGGYNNSAGDNCPWALNIFNNGRCTNWGNPQSEIYLESLRYLSGQSANFSAVDNTRIAGLNEAVWAKPVNNNNYCAPLSVIQFNASTSSYDADELSGVVNINLADVAALSAITNSVGTYEGITGTDRFVGRIIGSTVSGDNNQLCTAKNVSALSAVSGTCPDAPRLDGSYQIVGLAHHARKTGIPLNGVTSGTRSQTVRTYGVALAPAVPKVEVLVPGNATRKITILPACRNGQFNSNCAIVDFKIVDQQFGVLVNGVASNTGRLYVNWEDSEQGGDFDQDMWGIIDYRVTGSDVSVTTRVVAQSTPDPMGFGYVIGGTNDDGFKVHSGIQGFTYGTSCTAVDGNRCTCRSDSAFGACNSNQAGARTQTYQISTAATSALTLEQPLYYASKWGGYSQAFVDEAKTNAGAAFNDTYLIDQVKTRSVDDSYFFATDPRRLEQSLRTAFQSVADGIGSASAVATSSTRLSEDSFLYQARFNSSDWTGEILAYPFVEGSGFSGVAALSTNTTMPVSAAGRNIYTYTGAASGTSAPVLNWANIGANEKAALRLEGEMSDAEAQKRLNWLRGDRVNEGAGGLRTRTKLLGDIVNSSPAFAGPRDMRYNLLPAALGGTSYSTFLAEKRAESFVPRLFVGANDGMLHAFNANTLQLLYSYMPRLAFAKNVGQNAKLANLTRPNYGRADNPHQYIVDGPVTVGDAFINNSWRTIVVGTQGAGGRGVFALDVTDPNQPPKVIFEFKYDPNGDPALGNYSELGYVMGRPLIVPMKNNRWSVVFGNGSDANGSHLFVVDLEEPYNRDHTQVISTGAGVGLSAPEILTNGIGQAEWAYAGDLSGNLWRFDLTNANAGSWHMSYKLFQALDANGNEQAISAAPTLGRNKQKPGAVMVYVGTGKYFDIADNEAATNPRHSFYALVDMGVPITETGRSSLHRKTIETGAGRSIGNNTVDWATVKGWYLDFNVTNGERVTLKALLVFDRLVIATLIPSAIPCEFGGSSWLMQMSAVDDTDYNHVGNDYLILGDLGFGVPSPPPTDDPDGPTDPDDPDAGEEPSPPCEEGFIETSVLVSGSDGTTSTLTVCVPDSLLGRMSWRQLQ